MHDVGLHSTGRITAFFGRTEAKAAKARTAIPKKPSSPRKPAPRKATAQVVPLTRKAKPEPQPQPKTAWVQAVIEKSLRAAGLM